MKSPQSARTDSSSVLNDSIGRMTLQKKPSIPKAGGSTICNSPTPSIFDSDVKWPGQKIDGVDLSSIYQELVKQYKDPRFGFIEELQQASSTFRYSLCGLATFTMLYTRMECVFSSPGITMKQRQAELIYDFYTYYFYLGEGRQKLNKNDQRWILLLLMTPNWKFDPQRGAVMDASGTVIPRDKKLIERELNRNWVALIKMYAAEIEEMAEQEEITLVYEEGRLASITKLMEELLNSR